MEYDFRKIEQYWQQQWKKDKAYSVQNDFTKPKCYVLDMFPYPSGTGLHVGHPLGYIASDIYSRYKRLKGFNVLHPMGFDSFGLPAEQYAIETGQHPATTTEKNIATFKSQLDKIAFSYDWDREVKTSDPSYYKWTQWIFLQLFKSWYNHTTHKAESIDSLIKIFESRGNQKHPCPGDPEISFDADEWNSFSEKLQHDILMNYRLAFCGVGEVNWCEALGTVLANDEVVNGVSERGGYPVVKKKLRQWYLRITEYADRLLQGLETVHFSDAMKEMQTNWIGKSYGAEIDFSIADSEEILKVFTTRPDTIFGVDFMVIAPEHALVEKITTEEQKGKVERYLEMVNSRSERERMAEKKITGVFTGAYALNPFDLREIPIYIAEYVLAGYGTGAIMAVPCGDERDFKFAHHFKIPITNILGEAFDGTEANPTKEVELHNSNFLTGMIMKDAAKIVMDDLEGLGFGKSKVNYKMRDAAFSRQRYWGEPIPITWQNDIAYPLREEQLPLVLPQVETYKPGPDGAGPLENITEWIDQYDSADANPSGRLESNTMPGYAGSSWYFLRYMDPHNSSTFCDKKLSDYWNQVDLYIGGTEHAVGHLLYSRMWTKVLYDLGLISFDEPFKKLVNQGMITGSSRFVYRITFPDSVKEYTDNLIAEGKSIDTKKSIFISVAILNEIEKMPPQAKGEYLKKLYVSDDVDYTGAVITTKLHVDVNIVDGVELDMAAFRNWKPEYKDAIFICEDGSVNAPRSLGEGLGVRSDGKYICGVEIEKMSKSKFNTVNPNDLCEKYGADTFRMYEMFLGPVEQSKPWDTKGIEGVHRFLKKLWRLFFDEVKGPIWTSSSPLSSGKEGEVPPPSPLERARGEVPSPAELKALHKAIKKIEDDTERFSFNTAVSSFMICVNELADLKCSKKEILEPLLILLTPYAPHIAEELWAALGNTGTILNSAYPKFEAHYTAESSKEYPVSINGRVRTSINLPLDISPEAAEKTVLGNETVQKWLEGKPVKKFIFVKGKMINVVI